MTFRAVSMVLGFLVACAMQLVALIVLAFQFIITVGIVGSLGISNVRPLGLLAVCGEMTATCVALWLASFFRARLDRSIDALNIPWL